MLLPNIHGTYKNNYNLAHLTWFKVGGPAEIFFKPKDENDLQHFLQQNQGVLPVTVIGAGSNIIVRDGGIKGAVLKLGQNFTAIEKLTNNNLLVGAGCLNFNLAKFALLNNIKGFEFLIGIPGTIGGGIAMNAGSYGREFKDIVESVYAFDKNGLEHKILIQDITFGYRKNYLPKDLIFTKVELKAEQGEFNTINSLMQTIRKQREESQPITEKTGGSTFANPIGYKAWQLIDQVGLRGKNLGGASIAKKHCNFMINNEAASASDLEELGQIAIAEVYKGTGVKLEWEIKIIGGHAKI
ncbi:MAG: UDP-N-acetylmuramate dehydrogenase [Rickettsiaceae bacterium]